MPITSNHYSPYTGLQIDKAVSSIEALDSNITLLRSLDSSGGHLYVSDTQVANYADVENAIVSGGFVNSQVVSQIASSVASGTISGAIISGDPIYTVVRGELVSGALLVDAATAGFHIIPESGSEVHVQADFQGAQLSYGSTVLAVSLNGATVDGVEIATKVYAEDVASNYATSIAGETVSGALMNYPTSEAIIPIVSSGGYTTSNAVSTIVSNAMSGASISGALMSGAAIETTVGGYSFGLTSNGISMSGGNVSAGIVDSALEITISGNSDVSAQIDMSMDDSGQLIVMLGGADSLFSIYTDHSPVLVNNLPLEVIDDEEGGEFRFNGKVLATVDDIPSVVSAVVSSGGYIDRTVASSVALNAVSGAGYTTSTAVGTIVSGSGYVTSTTVSSIALNAVSGGGYATSAAVGTIVSGSGYAISAAVSTIVGSVVSNSGYTTSNAASTIASTIASTAASSAVSGAIFSNTAVETTVGSARFVLDGGSITVGGTTSDNYLDITASGAELHASSGGSVALVDEAGASAVLSSGALTAVASSIDMSTTRGSLIISGDRLTCAADDGSGDRVEVSLTANVQSGASIDMSAHTVNMSAVDIDMFASTVNISAPQVQINGQTPATDLVVSEFFALEPGTGATIAVLSGGTSFVYPQELSSLTIASVVNTTREDRLQFTLAPGGQVSLPASCGFTPVDFNFEGGSSYLVAVMGGNIVAAEYTPGSATV